MQFFFLDFSAYIKFFINLFALVNPVGMIPIFMSMTINQTTSERNKTNFKANFSSAIILIITLFVGDYILNIFGISINSFRIAGGILIIMIAMSMINGKLIKEMEQKQKLNDDKTVYKDISIVPLATPLIAGPGAISSTIVWSNYYSQWNNLFCCCLLIIFFSFFCWLLFRTGPAVVHLLGKTGINVLTRIMGLLLMSLGIEFITIGIKSTFHFLM
ncbi:UPF0056 membrane protein YhcE [Buchnera aphidicola (Eriosoma grossulariae)]|uniref:YchE family NAAT transporter n=1 Tax=Buchnera aphidicola TaxID=9 RepID=UPI003463F65D